ncbi:MAG: AIM24 family protein [Desulfobacter sp.]|nr:MAG: AIM24 family protein [Desulfobacter sp.]
MRFLCKSCGLEKDIPDQYAGKTVKCPSCKAAVKIPEAEPGKGSKYSIAEFVARTSQKDKDQGLFELESNSMLEINLDGSVWTKLGAMIAYTGDIKFTREGILEHGLGKMFKKAVSGEGASLTKAEGKGALYLADAGKKVSVLNLENETICVNGNDLLAFEPSIDWDITMMKKVAGMLAGGLFNVKLSGRGMIAITTHHDPLTLKVVPGKPVVTDPNATVAWSGNLQPELKTDISLKTFLGRGSGESIQMSFSGSGFVVVQPFEEVYLQSS